MPAKRKHVRREPNGRKSRRIVHRKADDQMNSAEAKSVAINARIRHGIPPELADLVDAGRPNAGTIHGRLALGGSLTPEQWRVAEWYIRRHDAYQRASLSPGRAFHPYGEPVDAFDGEADYAVWARQAIGDWAAIIDCLKRASITRSFDNEFAMRTDLATILDCILVRELSLPDHIATLRRGLDVLGKQFLDDPLTSGLK
jgi:hypothetical protein